MLAYFFILFGAILRVIPHPANFAPIGAIALFGGVYLKRRDAIILPLAAMIISDFFIGFDSWQSRAVVYSSFVLAGLIGIWISKHKNLATIFGGTLLGSILFYLITNFAFFYPTDMYSHNWSGIVASYINAIPFFKNTVLGDLFYVGILFGSFELAKYLHENYSRKSANTRA